MTGLANLLQRTDLLFAERAHRAWLVGLPPFRPRAGPLLASTRAIAPEPALSPGTTLLIGEHRGVGCLFWLDPAAPADRVLPFRGEARQQLELVRQLVPRALPALVVPGALDAAALGARRAVLETPDPGALDGASFGLSMGLAMASALLEEPVPADVVAMARLTPEGICASVAHLYEKLDVVSRWALGVGTVLVSAEQADEARATVAQLGVALQVEAVTDLADALRRTFGDVEALLRRRWAEEPARGARAARALLSLARDGGYHLLDWRAVASAARGLVEQLPDGEERWMSELAEHIANRHRDAPTPLSLREPWLRAQPRPFRLRLWAHVVQSAADGMDAWEGYLDAAAAELAAPGDEHPEDLALAAALGRAHAAWYDYGRAVPLLERAAEGWLALEAAHDATYAVSELLRVAGASDDEALFARTVAKHVAAIRRDPRATTIGLAFVQLQMGRASVQLGEKSAGIRTLAAIPDAVSFPPHLRASRLRWMANAEREGSAAPLREALTREYATGDGGAIAALGALDAGLEQGEPARALRAATRFALLDREAARLVRRFETSDEDAVARLLARHSRY